MGQILRSTKRTCISSWGNDVNQIKGGDRPVVVASNVVSDFTCVALFRNYSSSKATFRPYFALFDSQKELWEA